MAAMAPILVFTLIIVIPLHFADWATFCRPRPFDQAKLPMGYESEVTKKNKMQTFILTSSSHCF
jgi:hypothetical protein